MTFKEFKTKIRKAIGMVNVGEFVDDPVAFNSAESYDKLFSNKKFLKAYVSESRLSFYSECTEFVSAEINKNTLKKVLDFGCGTGHLLQFLLGKYSNLQLVGADFGEEGLAMARQTVPSALFVKKDIYESVPEFEKSFEMVFCTEVLEHLLYPSKALKNLLPYFKDEGALVICVPNGRKDTYEGHIQFWSPESWKVFIEENLPESYEYRFGLIENGLTNIVVINKRK